MFRKSLMVLHNVLQGSSGIRHKVGKIFHKCTCKSEIMKEDKRIKDLGSNDLLVNSFEASASTRTFKLIPHYALLLELLCAPNT